ncbi:hypothetical protein [Streptomyces sp. NPDC046759]|uniref:COG1470 family protein n=1 Tax=Streptomyces sp. NPDC046759 TaxID=3155019 RepID=UPI0033C7C971
MVLGLGAVLCVVLGAVLGSAPSAWGASTGWSVSPAGGGRPFFYAEGPPGTALQDTVSITNPGRAPVVVRLSGTGLRTAFADGAGKGIRVPARTRAEVPFTVTAPAGAAPGDRAGAVVARDSRGRTETVAVRLRVGGPALAALTVEHLAVHGHRITYELVNRGTTVLVPRLAVRADGVLGRILDRAPRTLPVRLRPGTRLELTEPWADRPALDAVDVRLTVTARGGAHDSATVSARFVPWPGVTGAAGVLLAGVAVVITARGRRDRTPSGAPAAAGSHPGSPASGDDRASGAPAPGVLAADAARPEEPAAGGSGPAEPASGDPLPGGPGPTAGGSALHGPTAGGPVPDGLTAGGPALHGPPADGPPTTAARGAAAVGLPEHAGVLTEGAVK